MTIQNIKEYFDRVKWDNQLYSFAKTFFTVFIVLYAKDAWGNSEGGDIELFNMPLIIINAKWALISIIRNVWKIGVEKK